MLRLSGGDFNAIAGILGLISGIWIGTLFFKKGYNLGLTSTSMLLHFWQGIQDWDREAGIFTHTWKKISVISICIPLFFIICSRMWTGITGFCFRFRDWQKNQC